MSKLLYKQPKSFDQQIELLKKTYGLKIENSELAKIIITNMNYYCIKGYGLAFKIFDPKKGQKINGKYRGLFVKDASIEQIYNYFNLDIHFKSLLFNAIHIIEKNVRSVFACSFSKKYNLKSVIGDNASQYFKNFAKALENFNATIQENYLKYTKQSADDIICWHINEYNNDYPLWVLVEYFYLAKLIWFLENIRDGNIKKEIRSYFGFNDYDDFISSLYTIKEMRNNISHFKRVVGTILPLRNCIVSEVDESINSLNNRSVFSFLLLLTKMLRFCDINKCKEFKYNIINFLSNNEDFFKCS